MEGKKRYIAIILFLLICLMLFTFATTGDEELEAGKGNGNDIQEVTNKGDSDKDEEKDSDSEKEESNNQNSSSTGSSNNGNSNAGDDEDLDGTGNTDNSAWDKALAAVEELEKVLTDDQLNIARELVEEITNSDQYKELIERVEDAEDAIDATALVEALEKMVEEAAKREDIEDASDFRDDEVLDAVNEIDGEYLEEVKEDLLDRIEKLNKILDDATAPKVEGIEDGDTTKKDVELTITDDNEVTTTVTKDGQTYEYVEKFTEEGTYELTVVDSAFNETKLTFTIDKTAPKFIEPKNGSHYTSIEDIKVEDATEVTVVIKNQDTGKEVTAPLTEDATYYITATDAAGNSKSIYVAIDNTYPVISGVDETKPTNKNEIVYVSDKFLTKVIIDGKEYTRSDFEVGEKNENFKFQKKITKEGTHTVVAIDKIGNTTTKTFVIDKTAAKVKSSDFYVHGLTQIGKVFYTQKGNKITVNVKVNEELGQVPTFTLHSNGKDYVLTDVLDRGENAPGVWLYQASYVIEDSMADGEVTFTISNIVDKAGNVTADVTAPTNGRRVIVDNTAPKAENLAILGGKGYWVGKEYKQYATNGTIVYVNVRMYEELATTPVVTLNDTVTLTKATKKESNGVWIYSYSYRLKENDGIADGVLQVKVTNIADLAGNSIELTNADCKMESQSEVIVDRHIPEIILPGTEGKNKNEYRVESGTEVTLADVIATVQDGDQGSTTLNPYKADLLIGGKEENIYNYDFSNGFNTRYIGRYNIYYEYEDLAGNKATATMLLVMTDTTPATITLPGTEGKNKNEYRVESGTKVTLEDVLATVTDNVDPESKLEPYKADLLIGGKEENIYNYDFSNGFDTRYIGRYNIYYTYTDKAGHVTNATMLLVMTDTTPATITIPGTEGKNKNEYIVESGTEVTLEDVLATVTDNVDPESKLAPYKADLLISNKKEENKYNYDFSNGFETNYHGRYNLYYTYTDKAGHTTNAGMMIVMKDTVAPTLEITEKGNMVYVRGKDVTRLKYTITKDGKKVHTVDSETCGCGNYFSITWLAKTYGDGEYTIDVVDAGGNKATATAIVDTTAPVATPSYTEKDLEVNTVEEFTDFPTFDVKDNYSTNVKEELISGEVNTKKLGTYELVYRFTDEKGNYTDVTVKVNVVDTTAPQMTLNGETNIVLEAGIDTYEEKYASATDNYDETINNIPVDYIHYTDKDGVFQGKVSEIDNKKLGTYKVVYTHEDTNGNVAVDANKPSHTYIIRFVTVQDTTAPQMTLNGETNIVLEAGIDTYEEKYASATDNYDETINNIPVDYIHYTDKDGVFQGKVSEIDNKKLGTYKVVYTHEDTNGNIAVDANKPSHKYIIRFVTVQDTINPELTVKDESIGTDPIYSKISFKLSDSNQVDYLMVNGNKFDVTNAKWSDANYGNIKDYLVEGENTAVLYDTAGNSTSKTFTMDWTAPTITIKDDSIGTNPIYSKVNFKLYDDNKVDYVLINGNKFEVGNAKWSDANYGNIKNYLVEGENSIVLYDVAGNSKEMKVTMDWTAPKITIKDDSIGTNPIYSKVNFKLYDDNKVDYVLVNGNKFEVGNAQWSDANYGNIKKYLVEGENTIVLYDVAGNSTEMKITMDWTAPKLTVKDDSIGTNPIYSKVNFKLYDDNKVDYVLVNGNKFEVGNAQWSDANYGNIKKYLVEGENTIVLYDVAGNSTEMKITMDWTAPTVEYQYRTDLADKRTDIIGSDAHNIVFTIYKDNKLVHTVDAKSNYKRFSIDWLGDGVYKVVVTDIAGLSSEITVTIDHTAPVVTPSYTELTVEGDKNATFNQFPTFEIEDLTEVKTELISGEVNMGKVGEYTLTYKFTDEFNNSSTQDVVVKVVDTTAPVVTAKADSVVYVEYGTSYTELGAIVKDNIDEDRELTKPSYINLYELGENNATGPFVRRLGENETVDPNVIGKYLLVYTATDAAGNASNNQLPESKIWVIVRDTTAPTFRFTKAGSSLVKDEIQPTLVDGVYYFNEPVRVTISDSLNLRLHGVNSYYDDNNPNRTGWLTDLYEDGEYTAVGVDSFNNRAEFKFVIDSKVEATSKTSSFKYLSPSDPEWLECSGITCYFNNQQTYEFNFAEPVKITNIVGESAFGEETILPSEIEGFSSNADAEGYGTSFKISYNQATWLDFENFVKTDFLKLTFVDKKGNAIVVDSTETDSNIAVSIKA